MVPVCLQPLVVVTIRNVFDSTPAVRCSCLDFDFAGDDGGDVPDARLGFEVSRVLVRLLTLCFDRRHFVAATLTYVCCFFVLVWFVCSVSFRRPPPPWNRRISQGENFWVLPTCG